MSETFDFEVPVADPAIRRDYEAAVGRLILAHNEVDYRLTTVIELAVVKLGGDNGLHRLAEGDFAQRLTNIALLKGLQINLNLEHIDITLLRNLNGQRNNVAHGHFNQNPFDGTYELVRQRGYKKQKRHREASYPINILDHITLGLTSCSDKLRLVEALYCFEDVDLSFDEDGEAEMAS